MQQDSGAKIQISKHGECYPGTNDRVLTATGNVNNLVTMVSLVYAHLQNDEKTSAENAASEEQEIKMVIEDSAAGFIIGKGGSQINAIQTDSGARVQISKKGENVFGERIVTVKGGLQPNLAASYTILELLQKAQLESGSSSSRGTGSSRNYSGMAGMGMGMGGMGMGAGGGMNALPTMSAGSGAGSASAVLEIDDSATGNVIGKRGSTVTQLQQISGARIQVGLV